LTGKRAAKGIYQASRLQRSGFDNAVVNWFGFAATLAVYRAVLPAAVVALLWWLA
jgi:hypothetical protein